MMIFGVPVEPELQMPRALGGVTSGRGSRREPQAALEKPGIPEFETDSRLQHLAQPRQLPFGQIPTHGDHDRTELPTSEGSKEMVRGVAQPYSQSITETKPFRGQRACHLCRPLIQFTPTDLAFGPVLGGEEKRQIIWMCFRQLAQPASVRRQLTFHLRLRRSMSGGATSAWSGR